MEKTIKLSQIIPNLKEKRKKKAVKAVKENDSSHRK